MMARQSPHIAFETAREHLTARVPVAAPSARAGAVRLALAGQRFDTVAEVVVCDGEHLAGLVNIEDLIAAPEDARIATLMDPAPPVVAPGEDQEVAAWRAVQRRETSLAVVDETGRFLGLIPPQRLLQVLLWEHEEDLARLGGSLHDVASARTASEETVVRRFLHRIPWLIVGLVGAFGAASIVGAFESQLTERVIFAFFIPGVVYMADAVGTQTETLVIRGLSVGIPVGRMVRRELLTGLLVGAAVALLSFAIALIWWRQADVALVVALTLLAACSIATVVAMTLPWAFRRLGMDPAFGSGPLATVLQDLLSIMIYFAIAMAIAGPGA
jgi:magnesium transporter